MNAHFAFCTRSNPIKKILHGHDIAPAVKPPLLLCTNQIFTIMKSQKDRSARSGLFVILYRILYLFLSWQLLLLFYAH
jgi:hypothetical protein